MVFTPTPVPRADFKALLEQVRAGSADPVVGLYGPDSMIWKVTNRTSVWMLATTQGAMLDVAHPWIAQGIAEHSSIWSNPRERQQKTHTQLTSLVYGDLATVVRVSRALFALHDGVHGEARADSGVFATPTAYRANELNALVWVHAVMWWTRLQLFECIVAPLTLAEREQYYAETKLFAGCFGIPESALPGDYAAFLRYFDDMVGSGELAASESSRSIMGFLEGQVPPGLRSRLWAFNSMILPPGVGEILGLPEDSRRTRRHARQMLRALKAFDKLPNAMTQLPAYREALARIEGRPSTDAVTRRMSALLGGEQASRSLRRALPVVTEREDS